MAEQPKYVSNETFARAVAPTATLLTDLLAVGYRDFRMQKDNGRSRPAAASEASDEITAQNDYAGVWDTHPIDTAYSHIGVLFTAAEDSMRAFTSIIVGLPTPIYAYVPITRAALECLALAHWLCEPGVGVKERVRRSLNERIESAYQQSLLPAELNPEPERQARILKAETLGFTPTKSKKGRLKVFAPASPTVTHRVKAVLGDDVSGQVAYSYASAISHGTLWGLVMPARPEPGTEPVVTAPLVISSDSIATQAVIIARAYIAAYDSLITVMGWTDREWPAARLVALQRMAAHIQRVTSAPRRKV
ncbi:MAG: hypothetical protein K8R99_15485 [Actinomycetia bacterium]|nr:hypothetical protein [Actinomycetes bacterium]